MDEQRGGFDSTRARLQEIVAQVRRKDVSLEESLDLLEEGVRLAGECTELSDATQWRSVMGEVNASEDRDAEGVAEQVPADTMESGGSLQEPVTGE